MASVTAAVAVASNRVRVVLSAAPAESGIHSAGLASNWQITRDLEARPVAAVERESATRWVLSCPVAWDTGGTWRAGAATTLRTLAEGAQYDSPARRDFTPAVAVPTAKASLLRATKRDFALTTLARGSTPAGCYFVASGDYALWAGDEARESDYLRRLQTPRGGFAHAPDYGVGLQPKRLVSVQQLLDAKREIAEQLKQEPRVIAVAPRIQRRGTGVVIVTVQVQTADGPVVTAAQVLG
ncbi:MAG: hypothetical protein Q8R92_21115 [Deltaproteobacteria bacterium]|nr:hypothetical protein [Deltaproteobacteria bacterium]